MRYTFYPDEEAIYFEFADKPFSYGKDLDDKRHLNFSADDEVIGIEFLCYGDGVDLSDIPEEMLIIISPILEKNSVQIYA